MALEKTIVHLRQKALAEGRNPTPDAYQGVSKERIADVLREIDRYTPDCADTVFALLDDEHDNWFTNAPRGAKFCEGASTAHIACHFGILQRGGGKSDREGRDYWLKPLWEIGAIEKVFLDPKTGRFFPGHPVAKSPYSAYRLAESFKAILTAPEGTWRAMLRKWIKKEEIRRRLALQAQLAQAVRGRVDAKHSDLIKAALAHYAPHFLPGYQLLYIDNEDGQRVAEPDRLKLHEAGIEITLNDSMPDALLWNRKTDRLWVIEAVTSDGEVDQHKVNNLTALAKRSGKAGIDFTTAYQTWAAAARRQGKHKNIAPGTYIWIQEDPSKHYLAEAFSLKR